MQIKKRYHSYPILAPYTNDYEGSKFYINAIDYDKKEQNYIFIVQILLEDLYIKDIINKEKAEYIIHVECSKTSFRQIYKTKLQDIEISIDASDLNGRVEFAPFIVAKEDIIDYQNKSFHEDFNSFKFDINRGQYLCIGNRAIVDIIKNKDELKQLSSIIRIAQVSDLDRETKVSLEGDRIQILVSTELYGKYIYAGRNKYRLRTLHSMLVYPALIHVLYELKEDSEVDFENYSGRRWFQALKIRFEELGMEINSDLFNEKLPYELAQVLLDYPIKDALENMYDSDQEES